MKNKTISLLENVRDTLNDLKSRLYDSATGMDEGEFDDINLLIKEFDGFIEGLKEDFKEISDK